MFVPTSKELAYKSIIMFHTPDLEQHNSIMEHISSEITWPKSRKYMLVFPHPTCTQRLIRASHTLSLYRWCQQTLCYHGDNNGKLILENWVRWNQYCALGYYYFGFQYLDDFNKAWSYISTRIQADIHRFDLTPLVPKSNK